MAKRRKRTNKNLPAKGRMKDIADRLWSAAIRDDWGHKCAMCGSTSTLNAHHLIPRQHTTTRYDLRNGICLCSHCHQYDADGPHQNAAAWMKWLETHQAGVHGWLTLQIEAGSYKTFNGTKNPAYYCDVIRELKPYVAPDIFVEYVGIKFAAWLEQQAAEERMSDE